MNSFFVHVHVNVNVHENDTRLSDKTKSTPPNRLMAKAELLKNKVSSMQQEDSQQHIDMALRRDHLLWLTQRLAPRTRLIVP